MHNVLYATFHHGIQIVYIFYPYKNIMAGDSFTQIFIQRMNGNDYKGTNY